MHLVLINLCSGSNQRNTNTEEPMKQNLILLISLILFNKTSHALDQAWDKSNNPSIFGMGKYEYNLDKLPTIGKLKDKPWSGDYWATYKGGISYRWHMETEDDTERFYYNITDKVSDLTADDIEFLSPAEKYDLLIGADHFPLTTYEKKRTNINKTRKGHKDYEEGYEIPTWFGLCHAWAPVTIRFGSSDIKALLTYLHHTESPPSRLIGTRCNLSFKDLEKKLKEGEITKEEFIEKVESSQCMDTNPGAL